MIQVLRTHRACAWPLVLVSAIGLSACRAKAPTEVEVEVRSIGFDNASNAPVVVLQDHDRTVALPIWIGPAEAQSIAMQMQGIDPPRPLTHDLIKTILERTGVEFRRVVIRDLKESTYYAQIDLHAGREDLQIDSRPSDAIALALRFHKPIFVATALLHGDTTIDLRHAAPTGNTVKFSGVTVQNLTGELADYFSLPPGRGVIVAEVASDAPKGLQRGDIILEVDGAAVTGVGDFTNKMRALKGASGVRLSVQRGPDHVAVQFAPRAAAG